MDKNAKSSASAAQLDAWGRAVDALRLLCTAFSGSGCCYVPASGHLVTKEGIYPGFPGTTQGRNQHPM